MAVTSFMILAGATQNCKVGDARSISRLWLFCDILMTVFSIPAIQLAVFFRTSKNASELKVSAFNIHKFLHYKKVADTTTELSIAELI